MADQASDSRFELEEPPPALLRWRRGVGLLPLAGALVASFFAYWPALQSPLYADDYLYLNAAKRLSPGEYVRASLAPLSHEPLLSAVTQNFWRPLYYLSFGLLEPMLGGNATAYHLVVLGIHLVSIVMVWVLARELTGRIETAGIAAVLFGAHPAGFEGVAWISSLSNAGLPLMLGSWLVFARGTMGEQIRWRGVAIAALLLALALGFRESTVTVAGAMAVWRLLWWRRDRLREWSSWAPLVPLAGVFLAYELIRTRLLTEPPGNSDVWNPGTHTPGQFWYYVKVTAFPAGPGTTGLAHWLQAAAGAVVLGSLPVLLVLRRWLMSAMVVAFLMSALPYAPLTLAVSPRYVYFVAAFFALGLAVIMRELLDHAALVVHPRLFWPGVALLSGAVLVAGSVSIHRRTQEWIETGPAVHQAWVDELRATYPTLPEGGTLYCANTPLVLALFDNLILGPTVGYYYPGVSAAPFAYGDLTAVRASLGPNDRIFVPAPTLSR